MTITLEYDQTEEHEQQLSTDSGQFNCLRYVHLVPSMIMSFCGTFLCVLTCMVLLLRDLEDGSLINKLSDRKLWIRSNLFGWFAAGVGIMLGGLVLLMVCGAALYFRRQVSGLRNFLQILAHQQMGESRDSSIFNSNQHFRRFPPPQRAAQ